MKTLTQLAALRGVDLNEHPSDKSLEEREALLEEALAPPKFEPEARTRPYAKGSRTPTVRTTQRFQFDEAPVVCDLDLLAGPRDDGQLVYRFRLNNFHAWVQLLKALVGGPLYFCVPLSEERTERAEELPRKEAV
ncbi:MAG: hypothetical protein QOI24_3929 [Acidobacteriota bacterium]|jgi:hypothetical protein|nr:hypothetical protein [Acidobacteriota bacterium]